jgi:VWFA-related protein
VFRDRQGLPMPSVPVDVPAGTAAARAPRPAPPSSPAAAGGTPPEVLAIVFDRLTPDARALAYRAAIQYLGGEQADRLIGVYGLDLSLVAHQPFTRDAKRVREALDAFANRATSTFGATRNEQRDLVERSIRASDQLNNVTQGGDTGAIGSAAVEQQFAEMAARSLQTFETLERDQRGYSTANGLLAVVSGMRTIPGRKAIVFFSEGLSIPPNVQERFIAVTAAANRANVSIYSIDAAGLRTDSTLKETSEGQMAASRRTLSRNPSRDVLGEPMMAALERNEDRLRFDPHSGLSQLSEDTGGLLVANTNDFRRGLARVDSDMRNYYMLSYVPSNDRFDGKYRNITVKVHRPGLTVQHRKGYLAVRVPPGEPVLTYEAPALAMLEVTPVPNAFPVRSGALRFPEPGRPGLTPVVVELPTAGLTFQPTEDGQEYTSDATVLVRFMNQADEPVAKMSQRYELRGPIAQLEQAKAGEIIFYREPELPPGVYRMETIAYDAIGGTASVRFVTVEKPPVPADQLRMSSVVLIRRGEKVPAADRLPGSPLYVGDTLVYPNLGAALKHGVDKELPFYFTAYLPRSGGDASATLELLHNARAVAKVPLELDTPDAERRIQQLSRIPVEQLEPGTYELRVTVRQGSSAVSHTATFRVTS